MLRVKEKVGVLPDVELDNYPAVLSGVARIDVDSSSGTIRVVPSIVDSCLDLPLVPGDALPAYRPSEIEYEGRRYILKEPLECVVRWDADGENYLWIDCASLDLRSTGRTVEEAIFRFNQKFAWDYEWFSEPDVYPEGRLAFEYAAMCELIVEVLPVGEINIY